MMQHLYLVFAIAGFLISAYATPATLEHGNLLFMTNPVETVELLFGNYVSAAFGADLLVGLRRVLRLVGRRLTETWIDALVGLRRAGLPLWRLGTPTAVPLLARATASGGCGLAR
jgi:hypothetical protein